MVFQRFRPFAASSWDRSLEVCYDEFPTGVSLVAETSEGDNHTTRRTAIETRAAWHHWRWVGLCLCLLLAACTSASAPATVTPTANRSTQATPITSYQGHTGPVYTVAWSPDGTRIASGGNDSTVQVWDARTGRRLLLYTGHVGPVYTVAWSPDGTRIASGSDDSTVQIWDAKSGQRLLTYRGHTAGVRQLAWSPDGNEIASGGNNTIQVWNATTGQRLLTYTAYLSAIFSVAWSPDGTRIASGGNDNTVQVWEATTGHRLLTYQGHQAGVRDVAWSLDGTRASPRRARMAPSRSGTQGVDICSWPIGGRRVQPGPWRGHQMERASLQRQATRVLSSSRKPCRCGLPRPGTS